MKSEFIDKLSEILRPKANQHKTAQEMFWVTHSAPGHRLNYMTEHGSMENYCSDCIDRAVIDKHKEWSVDRNVLMGQIYEAELKGYFTTYCLWDYRMKKHGKTEKFHRVKSTPAIIAGMKNRLKREYRIGTKFLQEGTIDAGERNGFCFCDSCGAMFNTILLLDGQELEHWEALDDTHFQNIGNQEAYEICEILNAAQYNEELGGRVEALAERICNIISENK